jgi:hypothetical protein
MRLNIPMIRRLLRRLRGGHVDMQSLATRTWTMSPAETMVAPRALYLEGTLGNLTKLSPYRSWERETPLIEGGPLALRASIGYVVPNVDIAGPSIYAGPATEKPGFGPERLLRFDAEKPRRIEKANLVTTWSGSHFFGTYLLDDLPLELMAEDGGENIALSTKPYYHEADYRAFLNLPHPPVVSDARVGSLTIYDVPPQSPHRAARYRTLRARLRERLASPPAPATTGVFLRRGHSGERRVLENEPEIEAALEGLGFAILDPDTASVEQILRGTLGAKIIVSVEGSQLAHGMFSMADDAAFLVLQPPDRFALQFKEFTDALGMRYAFIVGRGASGGFTVPLDDLRGTLDLLM